MPITVSQSPRCRLQITYFVKKTQRYSVSNDMIKQRKAGKSQIEEAEIREYLAVFCLKNYNSLYIKIITN